MPELLFRSITDKRAENINGEYFLNEIIEELENKVVDDMVKDFKSTVSGWSNKPQFSGKVDANLNGVGVIVFSSGSNAEQYFYVNFGTSPRLIVPRSPSGILKFKTGYTPSTKRGSLRSRSWSRSGSTVLAKAVRHPGVEARHFDQLIADTYRPDFRRRIENALRRAARRI